MKQIERNPNTLQSNGIQSTVKFGIKASGLAHIFNVLRNQLYSDKVMAVVREYTCNAVDAHIENDTPDRPIVVTIPTQLLPEFKVRDFGKALTDEEIQDVYAFYGESTKRQSNKMIGQLGLGSKSAFAYGDNFVINSFIDGTKCIYNAFIDPSQIGQISKIGEEKTDEENGVEIVVPVRGDDHQEFEDKAQTLFRYFPVRPIVKAANQRKFEYENRNVLFSGKNWEWSEPLHSNRYQSGDAIVVMGNIGYPLDEYALNLDRGTKLSNLLKENLTLTVPIGDLEISASREKLQYTDYTRDNLKRALNEVKDDLVASVSREFKDCKTLFDAKCLFGSIFDYGSPLYSLRDVLSKKLLWNGKPVDSDSYGVPHDYGKEQTTTLHSFSKSHRTSKYKCEEQHRIDCTKGTTVIENDIGHRRGILGRILPLIINQGKKPYIIQFSSNTEKTKWKKKEKFDGPITKLSTLPRHKLSDFDGYARATSNGSASPKDAKHSAKCFTFNFKEEYNRWDRAKSQCWEIAEADMDAGGVYVIIDKFYLTGAGGYDQEPKRMKSHKSACEAAGITFPKVYAFKVGQRNKVEGKAQWQSVWDYMKEQLKIQMEKTDLTQKYVDRTSAIEYIRNDAGDAQSLCKFLTEEKLGKDFTDRLADKSGAFATFAAALASMHGARADTKAIDDIRQFAKDIGLEFTKNGKKNQKPTHNLKALCNGMLEKYPMIAYLDYQYLCGWNSGEQKQFPPDLSNYINVVDVCNQSPAE